MKNTKIIIGALIIISLAFYGGYKYGQSGSVGPNRKVGNFSGRMTPGQLAGKNSRGVSGGVVRGEVLKKDDKSLTITLPIGGSQIIWYSTSTEVQKMTNGSFRDLVPGLGVTILGTTNSDGSFSAKSISLNPARP